MEKHKLTRVVLNTFFPTRAGFYQRNGRDASRVCPEALSQSQIPIHRCLAVPGHGR